MTAVRQYYYRSNGCEAADPKDDDCICWHDEGLFPDRESFVKSWRINPAFVDEQLESIMKAAGSSLRYYMPFTKKDMRKAMTEAIEAALEGRV